MPTPADQLPPGTDWIARRFAKLERELRELRAAKRLASSAIDSGSLRVGSADGAHVDLVSEMDDPDNSGATFPAITLSSGATSETDPGTISSVTYTSGDDAWPRLVISAPDVVSQWPAQIILESASGPAGGTPAYAVFSATPWAQGAGPDGNLPTAYMAVQADYDSAGSGEILISASDGADATTAQDGWPSSVQVQLIEGALNIGAGTDEFSRFLTFTAARGLQTEQNWSTPTMSTGWSTSTTFGSITGYHGLQQRLTPDLKLHLMGCFTASSGATSTICTVEQAPVHDVPVQISQFSGSTLTVGTGVISTGSHLVITGGVSAASGRTYMINALVPMDGI